MSPPPRILKLGRNCCSIPRARRAAVLIDGAAYFARLEEALRQAQRSIVIIGWDFDARIKLRPDLEVSPSLGDLLRSLAEARPELEVRILVWNLAVVHAPGAALPLLFGDPWQDHPRISLRLDGYHPLYGSQHQKIVCIDANLAFVGGIDLTVGRWDTPVHAPEDARRVDPGGTTYKPVHDVHMAVDGEAAKAVFHVAQARWRAATGEMLPTPISDGDPWPPGLQPDFTDVPVAIARTIPAWGKAPEVREVEALTLDALAAAQRAIYIEAQYLAESRIGDVLAAHLARDAGPEIVALVTHVTHGALERWIMGGNRNRMIRRLRRADRFNRFRAFFPMIAGDDAECEILVHSKLLVVDDRFLRIGSSNLNRRSMGLDTECDLAIEAADAAQSQTIVRLRNQLLAEHLGSDPGTVAAAIATEGGIVAAIERLNDKPRRLQPFSVSDEGPTRLMPGTRLLDPRRPFRLLSGLRPRTSRPRRFPLSFGRAKR